MPGMGVLIGNRPRRARAGAARKRAAPSPWLSAGGNNSRDCACGFAKRPLVFFVYWAKSKRQGPGVGALPLKMPLRQHWASDPSPAGTVLKTSDVSGHVRWVQYVRRRKNTIADAIDFATIWVRHDKIIAGFHSHRRPPTAKRGFVNTLTGHIACEKLGTCLATNDKAGK